MIVSGNDLIKLVFNQKVVTPIHADACQPNSIDLHLGDDLKRFPKDALIDPEIDQSHLYEIVPKKSDGRWFVELGRGYLGVTQEEIYVPPGYVAMLHGISSLGRLWVLVHCTAGLADSHWRGPLTLELVSLSSHIMLRPWQRVAQITFHRTEGDTGKGYLGKYAGDRSATPSKMWMERGSR